MATIAWFVRHLDANKPPFSVRDLYYYSHQEYLLAMKRAGAEAYFVTGNDSYLGKGRFTRGWTIDKVSEVRDFTPVGEIQADVVFDKGGFEGQDTLMVTDYRLRPILSDKTLMYETFKQYQPRSIICHNPAELKAAIAEIPGNMAVVKNPNGSGGKQVYIDHKDKLEIPPDETFPLIVQEFLNMSQGVPGIAKGIHDLRLLMAGSTIIGGTLREPVKGGWHSNVSRGGSERLLARDDIPAEVQDMARAIDRMLDDHPRYYSIDFAKGQQGWRLLELNNKPGLFRESNGPLARGFMDSLATYLLSLV